MDSNYLVSWIPGTQDIIIFIINILKGSIHASMCRHCLPNDGLPAYTLSTASLHRLTSLTSSGTTSFQVLLDLHLKTQPTMFRSLMFFYAITLLIIFSTCPNNLSLPLLITKLKHSTPIFSLSSSCDPTFVVLWCTTYPSVVHHHHL